MNKWLKWGAYGRLALIVACIPAYWWLFAESHRAPPGSYPIDIAEVRRLADTQPGEKPLLVRVETEAHVSPPKVFVVTGDSWQSIDLPISSYELVYRDHIAVLDTALNADVAKSMSATNFDSAAYARMSYALARASLIVVTHEHPDYMAVYWLNPTSRKRWPSRDSRGNRLPSSGPTSARIVSPLCICRPMSLMVTSRSTISPTWRWNREL